MAEMTPLAKRRMALGIDQAEMAKRIGVSSMGYGGWENGNRMPRAKYIPMIAEAFGMTPTEIVELLDETHKAAASAA